MADAPVPPPLPAAIRITRPYAGEDEFLEKELETLTRASITLLGAQARPQGVVLRFELVLTSGLVLVRGEGRVVGFKADAFEGIGGLTLRFTRLDTRSKALVDKAAGLRELRRPSTRPQFLDPGPAHERVPSPPAAAGAATASPAGAPPPAAAQPPSAPPPQPPSAPPASEPPAAPAPVAADAPTPALAAGTPAHHPPGSDAPPERDSLLERLRARARALHPDDVARLLSDRRRA